MAAKPALSEPSEYQLRRCFNMLKSWSAVGLVNRLTEEDIGLPSRNAAQILIGRGTAAGLLLREGPLGHSTYRLNPEWVREGGYKSPAPRWFKPTPAQLASDTPLPAGVPRPAVAYVGPAFGNPPLVPHVGTRCEDGLDADGELLPCVGGAIADHLRSQFHAAFVE